MSLSRRSFFGAALAAGVAAKVTAAPPRTSPRSVSPPPVSPPPADRFDPWIEVDAASLRYNTGQVARLTGGRPIQDQVEVFA